MAKQYVVLIEESDIGSPRLMPTWDTTRLFAFINDENAQELIFVRPDSEGSPDRTGDNLILYFEDDDGESFPAVTLGTENNYLIGRELTQSEVMSLQVAFEHEEVETEHSNKIKLRFGKSISPIDPFIPTPPSDGRIYAWQGEGWLDITNRLNEVVGP